MYSWMKDLFPINRSITGNEVRKTLNYLSNFIKESVTYSVPNGTKTFDWVVPNEWEIRDPLLEDQNGYKFIVLKTTNCILLRTQDR